MDQGALDFDPRIIEMYAGQLYRKADSVRVGSAVVGGIFGVLVGCVPLTPFGKSWPIPSGFAFALILVGALVGALIGYVVGEGRAFRYRLQAQMALFQVQIERNTAAAAQAVRVAVTAPRRQAPAPAPVAPAPVAVEQPRPQAQPPLTSSI